MHKPLTRDDLTYLFFYAVMACILTVPLNDCSRAIERNTRVYEKYMDSVPMIGTIPPRPVGNFWKLEWVDARKEKR